MTVDWTTDAERSGYARSPDYDATLAYLGRLAHAAPELRITEFGRSPEGRPLILVVAAGGGEFDPAAARAAGKPVVLVEAGIHSGEIEGNDAGMALLRDLTVTDRHRDLLANLVLLFIPVFNPDGHARASQWMRINQNGPTERGTRGTGQNINLNRDFIKADAPEMRAWLAMFNHWLPDLFVDIHSTNGADFQYDLTWFVEQWDNQHPAVRRWQEEALIGRVFPALTRAAHTLAPYLELVDHRDITRGVANFGSGPRFSTGYAAVRNRPAILLETHMLKDYGTRVRGTYDLVVEVLREVNARPQSLRDAVALADRETIERAGDRAARVPLALETTKTPEPFTLAGYEFSQTPSDISGDLWTQYDPTRPKSFAIPFFRNLEVVAAVSPPAAYAIPPAFAERVVAKLDAHGIAHTRISMQVAVEVTRYRLRDPEWAARPFEGRLRIDRLTVHAIEETRTLAAGTVVVPLAQATANVALHLLEPQSPDSLLRWGEFNIIFESREYADARVAEQLARDMLRDDPELQAVFDQRLLDPEFAADPHARLLFFFDRSPWAEPEVGMYPVMRLERDAFDRLARA